MLSLSNIRLLCSGCDFVSNFAAMMANPQGRRTLSDRARQAAIGTTMLASTLGHGGFSEKNADAGIITDFRPGSEHQVYGQQFAGQYRDPGATPSGGVLDLSLTYNFPGFGGVQFELSKLVHSHELLAAFSSRSKTLRFTFYPMIGDLF